MLRGTCLIKSTRCSSGSQAPKHRLSYCIHTGLCDHIGQYLYWSTINDAHNAIYPEKSCRPKQYWNTMEKTISIRNWTHVISKHYFHLLCNILTTYYFTNHSRLLEILKRNVLLISEEDNSSLTGAVLLAESICRTWYGSIRLFQNQ